MPNENICMHTYENGVVWTRKNKEDMPLKIRGISHWSIFTATDYITMPYVWHSAERERVYKTVQK